MKSVNFEDLLPYCRDISKIKPHVFLLGAGASFASFENGDKNGVSLPLMSNLLSITGLDKLLSNHLDLTKYPTHNFELFYDKILKEDKSLANTIESHIYTYFSSMELPNKPTLYDYLVLSLRNKDVIGTFNWDPFLWQAIDRNRHLADMPRTIFLHGNVAVGYDKDNNIKGPTHDVSSKGKKFEPTRLMYPVSKKDYQNDEFIKKEWSSFCNHLNQCIIFSIFGYSAPNSDVEAKELLKSAWGMVNDRSMEDIEILDILNKSELLNKWNGFIHTHHYNIKSKLIDSYIGINPRRSCEAFVVEKLGACFLSNNRKLEFHRTLDEMWQFFEPIIEQENKY